MTRRVLLPLVLLASLLTGVTAAGAAFPDRIDLPDGWQPEGIAKGRGHTLFVGSIPTGAVLRIDARTGASTVAVQGGEGRAAIGLKADRRERLFVAGGPTGKAFVYDARTGTELARFQLAPPGAQTFVNDVVLTRRVAWFTDSQRPVLYAVASDLSGARQLALSGFDFQPGFNLNGIVATPGGRTLLAIQTNTGRVWRIDPDTGASRVVDLGGATLPNGDGMLLRGRTLYVVQNQLNRIAVVRLNARFTRGVVVDTITHPEFAVPTTIARLRGSLYAVNARFGTPPTSTTDYWITRVKPR